MSYKAEDRSRVAPLVRALQEEGFSVWWDAHIGAGDNWRETITEELDTARLVIVVWSRRSVGPSGQFVRDEATRALRRGAYFPIRIDPVEPPLGFGECQAQDFRAWKGSKLHPSYKDLIRSINARLSGLSNPAPNPRTQSNLTVSRRSLIVAGAGGGLVLAGAGGWMLIGPHAAKLNSIAVLPFANLSGDPAQSYFSDGMAEELRSALSRIAGLQVVARASSEAVRNDDIKTVASKLDVQDILTGSIRRSPELIRVTAQLVDGKGGMEKWSETYDRAVGDALEIETDIANNVAQTLKIRLAGSDRRRLLEGGTRSPQAHDLVLRARASIKEGNGDEMFARALGIVDAALAIDPGYAEAWAVKAELQTSQAGSSSTSAAQMRTRYAGATVSAEKAIELAPNSRAGYGALANILDQQLRRREAYALFQKMLSLPGEDGKTLGSYAVFQSEMRRFREATTLADQSVRLDPLSPRSYWMKAYVYGNARLYGVAAGAADRLLALAPQRQDAVQMHANFLLLMGKHAAAVAEFEKAKPLNAIGLASRAVLAARQGDPALSRQLLNQIQVEGGDGSYYQQSQVLAQLGRMTESITTLKKAFISRDPGLTQTLVDPFLDPLRKDSRFRAFEKELDFPAV